MKSRPVLFKILAASSPILLAKELVGEQALELRRRLLLGYFENF
jgi:hypothetical protein